MYEFSYYPTKVNVSHEESIKNIKDVVSDNVWLRIALRQGVWKCTNKADLRKLLAEGLLLGDGFETEVDTAKEYLTECAKFLNTLSDDTEYCFCNVSSEKMIEIYSE